MSRPGRRSRPHSRPLTGNTPRRLASAGGGGDTNLDEELQNVLLKEYDDGEHGKKEAIQDVKQVLHQVAQDPMAQQMQKLLPTFLAPSKSEVGDDTTFTRAHTTRSRSKPGATGATPRHGKLTARPSTAGEKTGRNKGIEETYSVPNFQDDDAFMAEDIMRMTASAPTIPETRYSTASSLASSTRAPSSSSSSKRKSRTSKTIGSTTTTAESTGKRKQRPRYPSQNEEFAMSASTVSAPMAEEEGEPSNQLQTDQAEAEEGYMPYTENLLEITSDTEETEEIWKSDIVELTRIKSAPKGRVHTGPDSLELKYKDPIWPHQLFLNQILARHPSLTHLVLDGSELRFLRDLGSSLQSLITLSICDCGLRSLDGIYGMPNLRTLIARKNMIRIPTQLSFLRKLSYLDLSSNPISAADEFGNLRHCGELRILKLYDTPLAINESNFNKEIKRLVPQLKEIHPSRLYDLIGMPNLMVRSRHLMSTDTLGGVAGDHTNLGQNREEVGKQVGAAKVAGGGRNETNKKEKSRRNDPSVMPSLAYDAVMVDQPKPGIAYQKIVTNKTLKEQEQEHQQKESEIKDVSLGTGDFSGIFMAPKFLQHLEETMPPSTAEGDDDDDKEGKAQLDFEQSRNNQDEILYQTGSEEVLGTGNRTVLKKKSVRDMHHQQEQQQQQETHSSNKNHPRGDGDPGHY